MPYGEGRSRRELDRLAREYAATDDDRDYVVITEKGTRLLCHGINSARVLAGKDGTIEPQEGS